MTFSGSSILWARNSLNPVSGRFAIGKISSGGLSRRETACNSVLQRHAGACHGRIAE